MNNYERVREKEHNKMEGVYCVRIMKPKNIIEKSENIYRKNKKVERE
jgi:hypothetical protein